MGQPQHPECPQAQHPCSSHSQGWLSLSTSAVRRHLGAGRHLSPSEPRGLEAAGSPGEWGVFHGEGLVPTTLSYSSRVSLSPAVLLKLLVLEEEREMFDRPFSFSLIKGLERGGTKEGRVAVTRAACPWDWDGDRPSCTPPEHSAAVGMNLLGCFST